MELPNFLPELHDALGATAIDTSLPGATFDPEQHTLLGQLSPAESALRVLAHRYVDLAKQYHEMYRTAASGSLEEKNAFALFQKCNGRHELAFEAFRQSLRDRFTIDDEVHKGLLILPDCTVVAVRHSPDENIGNPATSTMPPHLFQVLEALAAQGGAVIIGYAGDDPEDTETPDRRKMN